MLFARSSLLLSVVLLAPVPAQGAEPHIADRSVATAAGDLGKHGAARRVAGAMSDAYRDLARDNAATPVRNVVLLIGDGMGDSEITIARNYAMGAGGAFRGIDALPVTGQYTHYSLHRESGRPNYVTDSAASATAFSSGIKTYNGAVGVDLNGSPHPSIMAIARRAGLATGNVTTAAIQDATPAAQYAHVSHRNCVGPDDTTRHCPENAKENGGAGSISEQLLDSVLTVSFGGGATTFGQKAAAGKWKGRTLLDQARDRGFTIVTNAREMGELAAGHQSQPILGLFAGGNMPVRWKGPQASYRGHRDLPPVTCESNPERTSQIPSLAQMTAKAIELLSSSSTKGFFLQVEGASIDKQSHAANPCGQIGETVDLDEAVQVALEFARSDGNTLVIVTADHAHAGQIVANETSSPGLTLALRTKDDAIMTVNYANAETGGAAHTGTQLRVAAFGPRAFEVSGLLDQTDIHFIIRDALGLGAISSRVESPGGSEIAIEQ